MSYYGPIIDSDQTECVHVSMYVSSSIKPESFNFNSYTSEFRLIITRFGSGSF